MSAVLQMLCAKRMMRQWTEGDTQKLLQLMRTNDSVEVVAKMNFPQHSPLDAFCAYEFAVKPQLLDKSPKADDEAPAARRLRGRNVVRSDKVSERPWLVEHKQELLRAYFADPMSVNEVAFGMTRDYRSCSSQLEQLLYPHRYRHTKRSQVALRVMSRQ